jgi:pyruvate/2-oxoglutarate dehydrogenase complex dihydrolipoamide acyltransferase (E2) component
MTDIIEVHFPEEQQDGTEATITQWLVAEGDAVQAHDAIVEIETDKVVVEVAAPESGRIMDIKIRQDEEVNPGDVLCTLMPGENLEAGKSSTREKALTGDTQDVSKERNRLSPAVRQRVLEHNIDISRVQGTGHDGRITLQARKKLAMSHQTLFHTTRCASA